MEYIGYFKYHGDKIQNGLFGAREAATALEGFDEVFRYFLLKEEPEFSRLQFDLPIKIEEGSWEILIPDNIEHCLYVLASTGVIYSSAKIYFDTLAKKAAEDGFFQTGPAKDTKVMFQKTVLSIQWIIKVVSHLKGFLKTIDKAKIKDDYVIITNNEGEELSVPLRIIKLLEKCPSNLFSKLASIVSSKQNLEIGVRVQERTETTTISETNRCYFYVNEEDDEQVLLPELVDGKEVTLTGVVTRANESAQSIGFQYQGHVITCKPEKGKSLANFKNLLISQNHKYLYVPTMNLTGVVERKTPHGEDKERIRIFFSKLEPDDIPEENDLEETDFFDNLGEDDDSSQDSGTPPAKSDGI